MQIRLRGVNIAWSIIVLLVMVGLSGPMVWAAPTSERLGQTVPTRTPTPPPSLPSPQPEPTSNPAGPLQPTPQVEGIPTLLPTAGKGSDGGLIAVIWLGLGVLGVAWGIRRRVGHI